MPISLAGWPVKPISAVGVARRDDFCRHCGSTVPNLLRGRPLIWLPIGLLDEDLALQCAGDFCLEDAMSWDVHEVKNGYPHAPDSLDALLLALNGDK